MTDSPELSPKNAEPEAKNKASGSFFAELKRRKVVRVAITYAIVAWLIVQIAAATFPGFEIPMWAFRFVVLMLILGFPVALILAWAFELTPEGIKLTKNVSEAQKAVTSQARRNWTSIGFAAALPTVIFGALAAYFYFSKDSTSEVSSAAISDDRPYIIGSLAVLPLKILPGAEAWSDGVDGLHEEMLNQLSDMKPLDLASRTSVLQYRDATENLRVIGEELGVDFLVEGSVQKVGKDPRLTLQVIEVATDRHVFSRNFEYMQDPTQDPVLRQKSFAFELALNIYRSLRDQRPPAGDSAKRLAAVTAKAEGDYEELGASFFGNATVEGYRDAIELLTRFRQIDPDNGFARGRYALILSQKASAVGLVNYWDVDYTRDLGLALHQALLVDPDDMIAQEQMGSHIAFQLGRPREGVPYLRRVVADMERRVAAGEAEENTWTYVALAEMLYLSGQAPAAVAVLAKSSKAPHPRHIYGWISAYMAARRPAELIDALISFKGRMHMPNHSTELLDRYLDLRIAEVEVSWTGSPQPALRLYEKFNNTPDMSPGFMIFLLQFTDRHQAMLDNLDKIGSGYDPMEPTPSDAMLYRVTALRGLGNETLTRSYLQSLQKSDLLGNNPSVERKWGKQAYYHAALGDRDAALKAVATCQAAMDPQSNFNSYIFAQRQIAFAYAQLGMAAEACTALDAVLSSPGPWMTGNFMVESALKPIRPSPEFEAVIRKHADQLKDPDILETYFKQTPSNN